MPDLRRGVKGLRLGRLPAAERGGDRCRGAGRLRPLGRLAGELGAESSISTLARALRRSGRDHGRIMSAEAYAVLAEIVDDNAQPLDQAVRPRVRAGAAISSRDYLRRWPSANG